MAALSPTFKLQAGGLASSSARPVGGPVRFDLQRGMDGAAESLALVLAERSDVAPGDPVTLELGFDDDNETVFTGHVVEVAPALDGVRVVALGLMDALLRLRCARRWESTTAGAVVRDLAHAADLRWGSVDNGPDLPRYAIDMAQSAAAHLQRLADRLGFELYTHRDGQLQFRALGAAANLDSLGGALGGLGGLAEAAGAAASLLGVGGAALGYTVGANLMAASGRWRRAGVTRVTVGGEGPASSHGSGSAWALANSATPHHGEAGDAGTELLVLDAAARTQDLARRFAAGQLATLQRRTRQLRLRTFGRAALELGDAVGADGAADDLINTRGYVRALRHRLGPETGFVTDLVIQADAS